jgi:hypothetical protein
MGGPVGAPWQQHEDEEEAAEEIAHEEPTPISRHQDEQIFVRRSPQPIPPPPPAPEPVGRHPEPARPIPPPPAAAAPPAASVPPAVAETAGTPPGGTVTQTLIFQAVPNFQAALALERSLKAMAEVREVRVADFDERQLTFQVTHELGDQLPRVLLTQRGGDLEFVDARPERVEFVFRS